MTAISLATRADPVSAQEPSRAFFFLKELSACDAKMPLDAILVLAYLYHHRNAEQPISLKRLRLDLKRGSTDASRGLHYWPSSMISTEIDPEDRRGRLLRITNAGIAYFEKLEAYIL